MIRFAAACLESLCDYSCLITETIKASVMTPPRFIKWLSTERLSALILFLMILADIGPSKPHGTGIHYTLIKTHTIYELSSTHV